MTKISNKKAIEIIKKNWPDSRYSMLREALELAIKQLEERPDKKAMLNEGVVARKNESTNYKEKPMIDEEEIRKTFRKFENEQGGFNCGMEIEDFVVQLVKEKIVKKKMSLLDLLNRALKEGCLDRELLSSLVRELRQIQEGEK